MTIVSLFLVLIPGLYAWWAGRRLVTLAGDAAFSELLFNQAKRQLHVLLATWVAILLLSWSHALWLMPLALLSSLAGAFPARRAILDEEWNFLSYFGYQLRLLVGFLGPWLLVFTAPLFFQQFVGTSGMPFAVAALTLAVALWSVFGADVLLWILRARPLEDHRFDEPFDRVLKGATCSRPNIYRAGPRGGTLVNGLAVPTPWSPTVLLSDGLLEQLSPAEVGGIFAHEVAHLEQFTTKRWWSRIALAPLFTFLLGAVYLTSDPTVLPSGIIAIGWPVLCLLLLAMTLSRSRADETASDLRAVDLTGDAQTVINALKAVHVLNRHPRRIDPALQDRMTHPSLAHRLQSIREQAGGKREEQTAGPTDWGDIIPVDDPLVLRTANDDQAIALGKRHLEIFDHIDAEFPARYAGDLSAHAGEVRSIRMKELVGLRLDASGHRKRNLVLTDRRQKKTVIPIAPEDAAALQARLDQVDRYLGHPDKKHTPWLTSDPMRLVALVATLLGLVQPISIIFALAALAAFAWPTASALVAAGVVAIVEGLVLYARETGWQANTTWTIALAGQLVMGLVLIAVGVKRIPRQAEENRKGQWIALGILLPAVPLVLIKAIAATSGPLPAMQLHLWSSRTPAMLFLLALGTALVVRPKSWSRASGVGLLIVSLVLGVASTEWFRVRSSGELFVQPPGPLSARPVDPIPARILTLEGSVSELAIAHDGRVAARLHNEYDEDGAHSAPYLIEFEGGFDELSASQVAWADDGSILMLQGEMANATLKRLDRRARLSWVQQLPLVIEPRLSTDGDGWTVVARDTSHNGMVAASGSLPVADAEFRSWRLPDSTGHMLLTVSPGLNTGALMVGSSAPKVYHSAVVNTLFFTTSTTSSLWRPDSTGAHQVGLSAFYPQCEGIRNGYVCSASTRHQTEFWRLDDDQAQPLGSVAGWHWTQRGSGGLVIRNGSPVVRILDLETLDVYEVDTRTLDGFPSKGAATDHDQWGSAWAYSFAYLRSQLAVARSMGDRSVVVIYDLDRPVDDAVVAAGK